MRTGELAKRLGRPPGTVRFWCDRYAEFLSKPAVGRKPGARRVFTERDALILATVAELADQGITGADVEKVLRDGELVPTLPDLPTAEEQDARQAVQLVPVAELRRALDQVRYLQDEIDRVIAERDAARLAREQADRRIAELREALGRARGLLYGILAAGVFLAALVGALVALLVR